MPAASSAVEASVGLPGDRVDRSLTARAVATDAGFTVGQAEGSGSYTTGSAGQQLIRSKYYWRVRSNDGTVDGSWATANGGSVAFYVGLPTAGVCP